MGLKAVVMRSFGGPEVLALAQVPDPAPPPGEVLIRVHAVSVNRTLDLMVRQDGNGRGVRLPHVLGVDPSGVVAAVGPGVRSLAVGQRVATLSSIRCGRCTACLADNEADCMDTSMLGIHRWGGYAEYVTVPAENAVALPDGLSFAEATVIVRHVPTAHHLLVAKAGLRAGEWVLVMGASGGLGSSGVQVARLLGAHVIAGAGADERVQVALGFGAEHGVDYRATDLADEVMRITGGRGVDVVFENISDPDLWPRALASLAPSGRLVTAGTHGGGVVSLDVRRLYRRRLRIIGGAGYNRADVERALTWAAEGRIRAMPLREMPLGQAAEAHRLTEAGEVLGKLVLNPTLD